MMNNNQSSLICVAGGWGLGAVAAVLAFVLLMMIGGWGFIPAVFAAVVIFIIVGSLLSWTACKAPPAPTTTAVAAQKDAPSVVPSVEPEAAPAAVEQSEVAASDAEPEPTATPPAISEESSLAPTTELMKPSAALAGESELAARKGAWRYEGGDVGAASVETVTATDPVADTAPVATSDVGSDGDGVVEGTDEGTRPEALDGPRGGTADNLTAIKGIGPKLEIMCHTLGFYHFDQIANWTEEEVAWVNANLEGFKGRVSRDEWVAQAKILAAGGDAEVSKRVDKGGVS